MKVIINGWSKPKNCNGCPFNKDSCWCKITHAEIDRDFYYTIGEKCPIDEIEEN